MQKVLLPEGDPVGQDDRVVRAAREIVNRGIHPILIGDNAKLLPYFEGVSSEAFTIVAPCSSVGIIEQAAEMLRADNIYALIAGATMESSDVMKPCLRRLNPCRRRVSSCMIYPETEEGKGDIFCIADPAMIHETPEELGAAAAQAYRFVASLRKDPAMAIISAETRSKNPPKLQSGVIAAHIRDFVLREIPDAVVDGPMQYDAARSPLARLQKGLDDSLLDEQSANIVFYQTLEEGNGAYKMFHIEAERPALGPILLGLEDEGGKRYKIADLSRAVEVRDIVLLAELLSR